MNLVDLLLRAGTTTPDAPALIAPARTGPDGATGDGDRTITHGELAAAARAFAAGIVADGISPGDRVVVCAPNTVGFVVAELGILTAGAVVVPVNPLAPVTELRREIDEVDAALVVCDPSIALDAGDRRVVDTPDVDIAADGDTAFEIVDRDDDAPAALLFTSGTAGAPKAAVLTHANLRANLEQIQNHAGLALRPGDVGLGVLPFFHVFGLNVVLGLALASGGTLVVGGFDDTTVDRIVRHGVTVVAGVPAMYQAWLSDDAVDAASFSSVRLAVSGAAALAVEVGSGFRDRFGVVLHQGYGLTETSPAVTTTALSDDPRPGSIGPPLPGVEVRLVDTDGTDALAGDPGEIWVRGPNVFPGYWHDEEATANALTPEGWLRTGDIAVADAEGELSLVDRSKDLIIVSGFNVFPAEVEDALRGHPSVEDVAVLGEPDGRTGETVVAYVVAAAGATVDAEELRTHATGLLARYKCPTRIAVVEELPRTSIGKVLRRQLRATPPA